MMFNEGVETILNDTQVYQIIVLEVNSDPTCIVSSFALSSSTVVFLPNEVPIRYTTLQIGKLSKLHGSWTLPVSLPDHSTLSIISLTFLVRRWHSLLIFLILNF